MRRPLRSKSHVNEDKSKRRFEEVIEPFYVSNWTQRDYGIDALVDIANYSRHTNKIEVDSKRFLVQLKSIANGELKNEHLSYPVSTAKIDHWYKSNLPVALCIYLVNHDCFYYIWIDENLISHLDLKSPNWGNQKTVTIRIPSSNIISRDSIESIGSYVTSWKISSHRELNPEVYFALQNKGLEFLNKYKVVVSPFLFNSVRESTDQLLNNINNAIYRIAITGLSRVGKSSIINALLGRHLSPTGLFQTTGVPIQIIPGAKDYVTVYYLSGQSDSFPYSPEIILDLADQSNNEDNKKQIQLVSISVRNQNLERGIALYDIPGLDDPNDDLVGYSWQTIGRSNAIIYVVDVSPFEHGGFIFKNEFKRHLTEFKQQRDRVFLVFNKVDALSTSKLSQLKIRITQDLEKHNLLENLHNRIFFLSSEKDVPGEHTIGQLEKAIWSFVLAENKHGIAKLCSVSQEMYRSTCSFIDIVNSRLLDDQKRQQVQILLDDLRKKTANLEKEFKTKFREKYELIRHSTYSKRDRIIDDLEDQLKRISISEDLPDSNRIRNYLQERINISINELNGEYESRFGEIKMFVDNWIEDNLKYIRRVLSSTPETKHVDFTDLHSISLPPIDLTKAVGTGLITAALGVLLAIEFAPVIGIIGFIVNLFSDVDSRRSKRITILVDEARAKCTKIFDNINTALHSYYSEHVVILAKDADKHLNAYYNDIESQLNSLQSSLTKIERKQYYQSLDKIREIQMCLQQYEIELRSYCV